ncbi:hypothetical protein L596_016382 [Steinernema carpocapsae]|uniref:Uncharacterized protein n=1 Tax=Steinernema carpocapsae TaxID=34508 RepID=A0A4U5NIF2_STECR|nr:hypothetical protein L596_016382 [Steinernema carpocapsae]
MRTHISETTKSSTPSLPALKKPIIKDQFSHGQPQKVDWKKRHSAKNFRHTESAGRPESRCRSPLRGPGHSNRRRSPLLSQQGLFRQRRKPMPLRNVRFEPNTVRPLNRSSESKKSAFERIAEIMELPSQDSPRLKPISQSCAAIPARIEPQFKRRSGIRRPEVSKTEEAARAKEIKREKRLQRRAELEKLEWEIVPKDYGQQIKICFRKKRSTSEAKIEKVRKTRWDDASETSTGMTILNKLLPTKEAQRPPVEDDLLMSDSDLEEGEIL